MSNNINLEAGFTLARLSVLSLLSTANINFHSTQDESEHTNKIRTYPAEGNFRKRKKRILAACLEQSHTPLARSEPLSPPFFN